MINRKKTILEKNAGKFAISQMVVLMVSIIAFSYLIGSSVPLVSADIVNPASIDIPSHWFETIQPRSVPSRAFSTPERTITPTRIEGVGEGIREIVTDAGKEKVGLREIFSANPSGPGGWGYVGYGLMHLGYAAGVYSIASSLGNRWDLSDRKLRNFKWSAASAYFAGSMITKVAVAAESSSWILTASVPWLGISVLGLGAAIFVSVGFWLFGSTDQRYDSVTFSCMPWDAPMDADESDCRSCNDEDIPCTEYRCMSLGTHCEYLEDEGICDYNDEIDVRPVVIEPNEDELNVGYEYTPDGAVSPPDRGVKIVPEDDINGCVDPFTPIRFGVSLFSDTDLNEPRPARCKISRSRPDSFDGMNIWLSNGLNSYDHSFQMSLPSTGSLAAENISLREGGDFSLYVRCETRQGYANTNDFIFNFCVDDGPNTWEPEITRTSIMNNSPISHFEESDEREVSLRLFTNEPAQCRLSSLEQAYEDMSEENQVSCPRGGSVVNSEAQGDYRCEETTLRGLLNNQNNDFYFSCIDQPHLEGTEDEHLRNRMEIPYHFRLIGTEQLAIISAQPNNITIRDATQRIRVDLEVETFEGFDRGDSICSFSPAGEDRFTKFFETGTHLHSQPLDLDQGDYLYDIRCTDAGGNSDTTQINFIVETDTTPPVIVRAFREGNDLKIITDEDAECVYSTVNDLSCGYSFNDGSRMTSDNGRIHSTTWESNRNFYIKCQDEFSNRPTTGQCSMTVRPFDVS